MQVQKSTDIKPPRGWLPKILQKEETNFTINSQSADTEKSFFRSILEASRRLAGFSCVPTRNVSKRSPGSNSSQNFFVSKQQRIHAILRQHKATAPATETRSATNGLADRKELASIPLNPLCSICVRPRAKPSIFLHPEAFLRFRQLRD